MCHGKAAGEMIITASAQDPWNSWDFAMEIPSCWQVGEKQVGLAVCDFCMAHAYTTAEGRDQIQIHKSRKQTPLLEIWPAEREDKAVVK